VYPRELLGDCPFVFPSRGKWFLHFADYHYKTANHPEGPYNSTVKAFDCGDLRIPKLMCDGQRFILIGWILDYDGSGYHLKIYLHSKAIELGSKYKSYKRVCAIDPSKLIDIGIFLAGRCAGVFCKRCPDIHHAYV